MLYTLKVSVFASRWRISQNVPPQGCGWSPGSMVFSVIIPRDLWYVQVYHLWIPEVTLPSLLSFIAYSSIWSAQSQRSDSSGSLPSLVIILSPTRPRPLTQEMWATLPSRPAAARSIWSAQPQRPVLSINLQWEPVLMAGTAPLRQTH